MKWFILSASLLLTAQMAQAREPQVLAILPDGNVRIDSGPELDMPEFRVEIQRLAKRRPKPAFVFQFVGEVKFETVGAVVTEMQRNGIEKIGFAVRPNSN